MCVTVGHGSTMMCRIDPAKNAELTAKPGVRSVTMRGREYKGFLRVDGTALKAKNDLDYWVGLALVYNKKARPSKKRA
jgi:hypothetical protein